METNTPDTAVKRWSAAELRKLPVSERDAILEAAAALAEQYYLHDPDLTAFDAFGPDDLYGESSNTEAGRDLVD